MSRPTALPAYLIGDPRVRDYARAAGYLVPPEPAAEPPAPPEPTPAEKLNRAHDAVEDADADLAEYRTRWRMVLATLAAGCAGVATGAALTWVGVWGPALPLLIIAGLVVLVSGIACWSRFTDVDGAALRRNTRTARRRLRDAYTAAAYSDTTNGGDTP